MPALRTVRVVAAALVTAATLATTHAPALAAQAAQPPLVSFSAGVGLSTPIGDFERVAKAAPHITGRIAVAPVGAPWFGLRGDVSWERFADKAPSDDAQTVLGLSANALLRLGDFSEGNGARIYFVGGLGYWQFDSNAPNSEADGNLGTTVGAGVEIAVSDLVGFVEARAVQVNVYGGNVRWVPFVVGLRF